MEEEFKILLNFGLKNGLAGYNKTEKLDRAGFSLKSSHFVGEWGEVYHDEWTLGMTGGGQELAMVGNDKHTRLYGGGVVFPETLGILGINKKDVKSKLKEILLEHADKTRLISPFKFKDGSWEYIYSLVEMEQAVPVDVSKEVLFYKKSLVFVHYFINCPVR